MRACRCACVWLVRVGGCVCVCGWCVHVWSTNCWCYSGMLACSSYFHSSDNRDSALLDTVYQFQTKISWSSILKFRIFLFLLWVQILRYIYVNISEEFFYSNIMGTQAWELSPFSPPPPLLDPFWVGSMNFLTLPPFLSAIAVLIIKNR